METARRTFEEGAVGEALPSVEVTAAQIAGGIGLLSACVDAGLAASNGEVRRQVRGKAVRVNDELVEDETLTLTADHLKDGVIKLSIGRKRHALLKVAA
jgi:tyrosyl-tRNA synthetase